MVFGFGSNGKDDKAAIGNERVASLVIADNDYIKRMIDGELKQFNKIWDILRNPDRPLIIALVGSITNEGKRFIEHTFNGRIKTIIMLRADSEMAANEEVRKQINILLRGKGV